MGHTSQNKHNEGDQRRIAHIEHGSSQPTKAHTRGPENQRVDEHVSTGHTGTDKCPPVPPVVLGAQQEIHQQHSRGRRGDNHQAVTEEQETEHVIDLVGPQRCHDKVQLNKDGAEWKNAGQQNGRDGAQATGHRGNLAGDLIRLGWALD